jgi:hypothetical protein
LLAVERADECDMAEDQAHFIFSHVPQRLRALRRLPYAINVGVLLAVCSLTGTI